MEADTSRFTNLNSIIWLLTIYSPSFWWGLLASGGTCRWVRHESVSNATTLATLEAEPYLTVFIQLTHHFASDPAKAMLDPVQ
jgi:hypothetical protein